MTGSQNQKGLIPWMFLLLAFVAALALIHMNNHKTANFTFMELTPKKYEIANNPLNGCYHVYLDVGTNIGIQIRKLYEPKLYPNASIHSVFNKYFKRNALPNVKHNLPYICSVGFEPNPHHEKVLKELEEAYLTCNWNVKIFTKTAVSNVEGITSFYSDKDTADKEWGGTVIDPEHSATAREKVKVEAKLMRLSNFVNTVVATRSIPKEMDAVFAEGPKVVMKMDIEGSEVEVLPDLLSEGSFKFIDVIMVEFHQRNAKTELRKSSSGLLQTLFDTFGDLNQVLKQSGYPYPLTELVELDDESYRTTMFELPKTCEQA